MDDEFLLMPAEMPAEAPVPDPVPAPLPGPTDLLLPAPAEDPSLRRGAGVTLIGASIGLGLGLLIAGPLGGAAGVTAFGATRNTIRAKRYWSSENPEERAEAGKSATMALFGFGVVGVLIYHRYKEA